MISLHPIYTEKTTCRDCYKCVRNCPVKAIRVEDHSAEIKVERCVSCGNCFKVCPANAKIIRNDLAWSRYLIQNENVAASVAPSFIAEFPTISFKQLAAALTSLGFKYVSQAAAGAAVVNTLTAQFLNHQTSGIYYSTSCPSVVETIAKYFPHLQASLIPVPSPMTVHARLLRQKLGEETKVIFIGPCASKKHEAELVNDSADAVITFAELREWFKLQKINIENTESQPQVIDFEEHLAAEYPLHGGMISGLKPLLQNSKISLVSASGLDRIYQSLSKLTDTHKGFLFCESLACDNGCLNGPGMTNTDSDFIKAAHISTYAQSICAKTTDKIDLELKNKDNIWSKLQALDNAAFSEEEMQEALHTVGKFAPDDELNCSGCGYNTCRDFARAMLQKNAEPEMCVSHMRKLATEKASALLQKIPYGVVMTNDKLEIVDCNEKFAEMIGGDVPMLFDANPGLKKADLTKLISFHRNFSSLLNSGEENAEYDIRDTTGFYSLTVFTLQKSKLVCGILRNLQEPEIRRDMVVTRTQQVIQRNLEAVQQIATLLGENAAFTESMLNSIYEAFEQNNPNHE
jgi:iron only hydrogenase large subunit-like protein